VNSHKQNRIGLPSHEKNSQGIFYIEHQMASSRVVESLSEYKEWLKYYVRRLTSEGNEYKLNELFLSNPNDPEAEIMVIIHLI
jgi:hypothetical protein